MEKIRNFIINEIENGTFRKVEIGHSHNPRIYYESHSVRIPKSLLSYITIKNSGIPDFSFIDIGIGYFERRRLLKSIENSLPDRKEKFLNNLQNKFEKYISENEVK